VLIWRKSSKCEGGNCLEVSDSGHEIQVRNSTFPDVAVIKVSRHDWGLFLRGIVNGELAGPGR
jgi:hypothetical protein